MAENNGWIKLHRKILDNPIVMKDADHLAVWIYLLLNASHKGYPALFGGKKVILQPGQLITGRLKIAEVTGVQSNKVYRILNLLKNEHQIEQQTSSKNSLITITNWELYQESEQQNEQQVNNKCTTNEHKQECKNIKNVKKKNGFSCTRNYDYEDLENKLTLVKME